VASAGVAARASSPIYSGREQDLVGPLLDRYAKQEGVDIKVRYGTAFG